MCVTKTKHSSLRVYYEVLISVISYYYGMGGIYWPRDDLGALSYWGYNEWNYHEGFHKFVTNSLEAVEATRYIFDNLQLIPEPEPTPVAPDTTVSPQCPGIAVAALSKRMASIERLPAELIEQISNFTPVQAVFALHLTSRALAHRLPLDQPFCYSRLVSSDLIPHLCVVDPRTCHTINELLKDQIANREWRDWIHLTRLLADTSEIVEMGPGEKWGAARAMEPMQDLALCRKCHKIQGTGYVALRRQITWPRSYRPDSLCQIFHQAKLLPHSLLTHDYF